MSANNWTLCPRCKKLAESAKINRLLEAENNYGKIPADEYRRLFDQAVKPKPLEETMREDYEIGVYNDEFEVNYYAHCQKCYFEYRYKNKFKIEINIEGESEE